ncbi:type II secretion system secretin GspD [Sansalvadorimonas sp. 2012CJ34-2]|uniref:Type II secretion system secretin GspD n=1 Tax=Parendozoicomonas callyspongiae TaxID=2942213 RepID=A0ABT0PHC5_9GAMM|nr:type II secretion system secretin GspD [Sansalvadorimonas sp. 2012CJ34-2]
MASLLFGVNPVQAKEQPKENALEARINIKNGDLLTFVRWVAKETGKTFIIDPRVKGKITVVSQKSLETEQIYQLFLSVLQVHGYALIDEGGIGKVVPTVIAREGGVSLANPEELQGDKLAVVVRDLANINAQQVIPALRPLLPQSGHLSAMPGGRALIMVGTAQVLAQVNDIVDRLDKTPELALDVIPLKYARVKDVLNTVKEIAQSLTTNTGSQVQYKITVSADERTNSLILAGDSQFREKLKQLIHTLDSSKSGTDNTRVLYLHYQTASQLVPILQSLSGSLKGTEEGAVQQNVEVSIQANDTSNALIVTAPPGLMHTMERVVRQLDLRRVQVLVEAVIVEVSDRDISTLGVQWNTAGTALNGEGWYGGTRNGVANLGSLDSFPGNPVALATGLSLGFYHNGSLRALIRALKTSDNANILSTPSLVTLDNEEAEIVVGQNIPFVTGSSTSSSTDTNNPYQTYERKDVGIKLSVKPRVNRGDAVSLEIYQEISSVGNANGARDIVTNQRSIKTRVLVDDGKTLVLGGLISEEEKIAHDGVPLLSDIPLLGGLFRSKKVEKEKRNLIVFLKPTILRDELSAEQASADRYERIRINSNLPAPTLDDVWTLVTPEEDASDGRNSQSSTQ